MCGNPQKIRFAISAGCATISSFLSFARGRSRHAAFGTFQDHHASSAPGVQILLSSRPLPAGTAARPEQVRALRVLARREILPGLPQSERRRAQAERREPCLAASQGTQPPSLRVLDRLLHRGGRKALHGRVQNAAALRRRDVLRPHRGVQDLPQGQVHRRRAV